MPRERPASSHTTSSRYGSDALRYDRVIHANTRGRHESAPKQVLSAFGHGLASVFRAIGGACAYIWRKSKVLSAVCLLVLALGIGLIVDSVRIHDRIFDGVSIGEVDLSGMTREEAADALDEAYLDNLFATDVYVFANEDVAASADLETKQLENEALAEQVSFDEAQKKKDLWIASGKNLEAKLPSREMAEKAYQVGRESGAFDRFTAAFSGIQLPVYAEYNEELLNALILDINSTLGDPAEESNVRIEEGVAVSTEGHDGTMMDTSEFIAKLNDGLLTNDESMMSFVANVQYTPLRISKEEADATRDAINEVIQNGASFTLNGETIDISREMLGSWVRTEVAEDGGRVFLSPYIDEASATREILAIANEGKTQVSDISFDIQKDGDDIFVIPRNPIELPYLTDDLKALDESLFSTYRKDGTPSVSGDIFDIAIVTKPFEGSLSLEDALTYGVIEEVSSYTTKYVNSRSTENRAFNIHHVADLLDASIIESDGGQWSFNAVAGNCDEESGFKEAGVMESGEMTTGAGGGICQVATTVFNSVYESGLPINERHNHSLHTSSYPAGRDAAIAYPKLDLIWTNSTSSDMILLTDYTDTSVTVTLLGRKPDLVVETEVGEWQEGEKFKVKYEIDEDLSKDKSYLKSEGTDGMDITVIRTVKDQEGNIIETDTFISSYLPVNKVIAYGKGSDLAAIKEKYQEKES